MTTTWDSNQEMDIIMWPPVRLSVHTTSNSNSNNKNDSQLHRARFATKRNKHIKGNLATQDRPYQATALSPWIRGN
eukprot:TCALIF_11059-PA protein Name:"Protein of unknown function" AED:0.43 eAED:0.43 QI:77/0.5/0.4/0.8/1/0.8/5/625/75